MSDRTGEQLTFESLAAREVRRSRRDAYVAGARFGNLVLIEHVKIKPGAYRWRCVCDCGASVMREQNKLCEASSCGCRNGTRSFHGHGTRRKTGTYQSWQHMRARCETKTADSYYLYGARGVTVCDRWRSFDNFLADMGERPPGTSIDRIDGARGYEPGNCRWATPAIQVQNSRRAKLTASSAAEIRALQGTGLSAREVGERFGVSGHTIFAIWKGRAWRVSG